MIVKNKQTNKQNPTGVIGSEETTKTSWNGPLLKGCPQGLVLWL